ncbi:MAG TPA: hypothetical protein DEG17_23670, partial [Cyanobacteria bacterium UBA11149]|nr:hypothetical protein [Cyanobacteria bacterium UBA11149]
LDAPQLIKDFLPKMEISLKESLGNGILADCFSSIRSHSPRKVKGKHRWRSLREAYTPNSGQVTRSRLSLIPQPLSLKKKFLI